MSLRSLVNASLATFDTVMGKSQPLITILCYHSFNNDAWFYGVSAKQLEGQLAELSQTRNFISVTELAAHLDGTTPITQPSTLITIDDGYQNIETTQPQFAKFGVKPLVFLIAKPDQAQRDQLQNTYPLLSWESCRRLAKQGWAFGCHTATHPNLAELTQTELVSEISLAKQIIEQKMGEPCPWIAYPKGIYTNQVLDEVAQAGFKLGFATDVQVIEPQTAHRFELARVGINRTHTQKEFVTLFSPSAFALRATVAGLKRSLSNYVK